VPGLGEPQQVLAQLATLPPAQSGALLQQLLQVPGLVQQAAAAGPNPNPNPSVPVSLLQQLAAAAAQQAPAAQQEHGEGAQQVRAGIVTGPEGYPGTPSPHASGVTLGTGINPAVVYVYFLDVSSTPLLMCSFPRMHPPCNAVCSVMCLLSSQ